MARSVTDAALLLNVICEPDARDAYSLPYDGADYLHGLGEGIEGVKIAYSETLAGHRVDPEIAALVSKAVDILAGLGAEVVEAAQDTAGAEERSEEHTSELQSLMRISYAVFCLKKKKNRQPR